MPCFSSKHAKELKGAADERIRDYWKLKRLDCRTNRWETGGDGGVGEEKGEEVEGESEGKSCWTQRSDMVRTVLWVLAPLKIDTGFRISQLPFDSDSLEVIWLGRDETGMSLFFVFFQSHPWIAALYWAFTAITFWQIPFILQLQRFNVKCQKGPNLNYSSSTYIDEFPVGKAEKVIIIREVKNYAQLRQSYFKNQGMVTSWWTWSYFWTFTTSLELLL